jgi:hypothetical protein
MASVECGGERVSEGEMVVGWHNGEMLQAANEQLRERRHALEKEFAASRDASLREEARLRSLLAEVKASGDERVMIAVSGTRHPLSSIEEKRIRSILGAWSERTLHVGDCPTGVDAFVRAYWHPLWFDVFEADWTSGRSAGPIRNGRMLRGCQTLIAFPAAGRESRGTMNTIEQAIRAGIETHVYPLRER